MRRRYLSICKHAKILIASLVLCNKYLGVNSLLSRIHIDEVSVNLIVTRIRCRAPSYSAFCYTDTVKLVTVKHFRTLVCTLQTIGRMWKKYRRYILINFMDLEVQKVRQLLCSKSKRINVQCYFTYHLGQKWKWRKEYYTALLGLQFRQPVYAYNKKRWLIWVNIVQNT